MRDYRKSDYAINKYSPNIVYRFDDEIIEVSLEDYLKENPDKTEQDFAELKALSDGIYYEQDRAESAHTRKDVSIHSLEEMGCCSTRPLEDELEELAVEIQNRRYENSNELMPFKNLFNEWHVRDCSRKVRNVVNAKAQRGIRVGTRAPYGYRKGATKDSPLLVDEEAAAVVKRIFAMCAGGMGPAQIAKQLKKECIYSPSMYAYTKFGTSHSGLNAERPYNWTGDMVADMLQNMVYLGHTVNLRYSTKSYKDKKKRERPKSEWLIFEHTHEALVDQETWDIVQEVRSHKRRRTNMDEQNMFSGLVYCADCGKPMVLHRAHTMKPEQNHFTCRTYKKDGAEVCSAHYIREVALKEIVLETIRRATEFARSDPERFAAYIQQKQSTEVAKEIRVVERELSTMRKRDGELDVVFKRMYEDSALGRVSNEQFRLLSEAYSKEKAQLAEAIPATEERLEKLRSSMANAKNFIAKAR